MFDTSSVQALSDKEENKYRHLIERAKKAAEPDAVRVREKYIEEKARELAGPDASEEQIKKAESTIRLAAEQKVLKGDFVLYLDNHGPVTVETILADKPKYHGATLSDPLEPDSGRNKAKVFLIGTRPNVNSFLHGGRVLQLRTQTRSVLLAQGRFHEITEEIEDILAAQLDLFRTDAGPVLVDTNDAGIPRIQLANVETLTARVAATTSFFEMKKEGGEFKKIEKDPPHRPIQNLTKRKDKIGFPPLKGIVSAPTLRPDGTIFQTPGYDQDTGLLYLTDEPPPLVPLNPTKEQLRAARKALMGPFSKFNYRTRMDAWVMLSALLTATVRRILPTAPGFIYSATVAGSGKTKLAQCVDIIAGGQGATHALPTETEELRKAVMSSLLEGVPGIIFDNVTGHLRSDLLCAVLSSPVHSDRILGASQTATVPTNVMFLFTGNNLDPAGDLSRRTLKVNLDPKCEAPWKREFAFDPVEVVRRDRVKMVVAALTLLRGYIADGQPRLVKSHTGSFEQWSKLVRQCVIWLHGEDPELAMHDNHESDPDTEALRSVTQAWYDLFGTKKVSNKQLSTYIADNACALRIAFNDALPHGVTINKVAHWMKYRRGRVVDGYRFEKYKSSDERGWFLEEMPE